MSTSLWVLLIVGIVFAATLELWADAINWVLRRIGFQGVGKPQRQEKHDIATVEKVFSFGSESSEPTGKVFFEGALWSARCDPSLYRTLKPGDRVEIERGQSVVLTVKRKIETRVSRPSACT